MNHPPKRVAIAGDGAGVAQCAFILAQLGAEVIVFTPSLDLSADPSSAGEMSEKNDSFHLRPLLLRALTDPRITFYTNTTVDKISRREGTFHLKATRNPRYVRPDVCTGCGNCTKACSVKVNVRHDGRTSSLTAIHSPVSMAIPTSAYSIDKRGVAPCVAACPLGINVQGFVSLLSNGKVDAALQLIYEAAPLAGVLGRVCTHPCEGACKRGDLDDPVFVKALHRYAADNARGDVQYRFKVPAGSKKDKIAIVGSGPAGLAAAWELARRGFSPVVYESHAVVGGMLATGIPRFRLPREIREKEVRAIERMGVRIRTGVTIGRDVTVRDLRERGYRAFFIAIGAHENRRMNIPGEDIELKGVADCTSFLFELNYGEGVSVGRNMVVIGGGNSAVDSARTAMRKGKRKVTILYRRTASEMTAIKEDIEEAIKEGVLIDYLVSPVEILHDGSRVTGIRCERMQLGDVEPDGRRKPIPIPGSDFVMEADHVVLAIGQQPDSRRLSLKALKIDDRAATIKIHPVTLETGIEGIFAGGDCVTGPNTVVDAMADGLRAAESIDRYLRGRSLEKGRNSKKPLTFEVNLSERIISDNQRSQMPVIPHSFRMDSFEETNIGLSAEMVVGETARCLNCAVCSECMECEQACDLHAVIHTDCVEGVKVGADALITFSSAPVPEVGASNADTSFSHGWYRQKGGAFRVHMDARNGLEKILEQASSVALEVSSHLGLFSGKEERGGGEPKAGVVEESSRPRLPVPAHEGMDHTAIFLCKCGGSISSIIDFNEVFRNRHLLPGASSLHEIVQACSEQGTQEIAARANEAGATKLVVAACRCCNLEQICFNCNDRRVLCFQYLNKMLPMELRQAVEYVNIREHCAWVHSDQPDQATQKVIEMLSAAVSRKQVSEARAYKEQPVQRTVLVVGAGISGLTAATKLADEGCSVAVVSSHAQETHEPRGNAQDRELRDKRIRDLIRRGVQVHPWPASMDFSGYAGSFDVVLKYPGAVSHLSAGGVLVCVDTAGIENLSKPGFLSDQSLLGRVLKHRNRYSRKVGSEHPIPKRFSFEEPSGIFVTSLEGLKSAEDRTLRGEAMAAQILMHLSRSSLPPRRGTAFVDLKLCRGCEECAMVCPLIEMKASPQGTAVAFVDPTVCLGCGACVACCPTGAIVQDRQGDEEIVSLLSGLLTKTEALSEVTWGNL